MARRRMFSLDVIDTDQFLDLPAGAQLLYFHLGMRADDDGFVASPKKIMTLIGSKADELRVLVMRGYVIPFESGVVVIADWKSNNSIQKDRYRPTKYVHEAAGLVEVGGHYHLDTDCIQDVSKMYTQVRIGKDRIDKVSKDVCAELQNDIADSSGILLQLVDGTVYDVSLSMIDTWKAAYPAVDIMQELRKIAAWLDSNPKRRRTRRGVTRFINTWLSKEQDKGGRYRIGQQEPERPAEEHIDDVKRFAKYLGNRPPSPDDPFQ